MVDEMMLKWPFFDDSHRDLHARVHEWASRELHSLISHDERQIDADCIKVVSAMGESGLLENAVNQNLDESGLDVRSLCLIREALGFHEPLADFAFAMQGLGSGPISLFGTIEQREKFLPSVVRGRSLAAFALSEPDAGSDVRAMTTHAEEHANHFVINGTKTWISNAGLADFYTVFTKTGDINESKNISCFVVEANNPGLKLIDRIDLIAPHPLGTIGFVDCHVPRSQMIGSTGSGLSIAMATLDTFRTTVAAAALGMARRAMHESAERVRTRDIYGGKLQDLQLVQGKIADMALEIDASALLIYRSAWTKDCLEQRVTREAAMAKLFATEAAQRVVDSAVQLHGGLGVTKGHIVERLYRDVRALRIYEGASEVQKTIISRKTLESV